MRISPWNIYKTRGGKYTPVHEQSELQRLVLVMNWKARKKMRSTWEGWAWGGNSHQGCLSGPFWWELHGNLQPDGWVRSFDLTEHLISARDLIFRKLNPPPLEWTLAAYQRRLLEDLYATT